MTKKLSKFLVLIIAVLAVFGFWKIPAAGEAMVEVTILADGNFSPATITITAGDQIRWTNTSSIEEAEPASDPHPTHEIYSALNIEPPIGPGGSVTSPALTQLGTWGYHNHACGASCAGTIIIQAAVAPPAGGGGSYVDQAPPVLISFSLSSNSRSAKFVSSTDEPALVQIEYGTTTAYEQKATSSSEILSYQHSMGLTNLLPNTTYYFRIFTEDRLKNKGFAYANKFTTSAASVSPLMNEVELIQEQGFRFTAKLGNGSRGEEVGALQTILAKDPAIYPEGLVTGYFGPLTEAAVRRFQAKYSIVNSGDPQSTGFGLVGPKTRSKLDELLTAE
ncbi:MAG: peptidoglycan-binding protein [bacterium]|nr:peptidoglycan-binding protein [bacterium]